MAAARWCFITFTLILSTLVSCSGGNKTADDGKLKIITSLFPQYDFSRQIAADHASVRILVPPGVEPHAFEPTPRDIADIRNADIFIYTGAFMEPWVEKIALESEKSGVLVIDAGAGVELLTGDDEIAEIHGHASRARGGESGEDSDEQVSAERGHGKFDPHIWTDPLNAKIMVKNIADGLAKRDPEHASFYQDNLASYSAQLDRLHEANAAVMRDARVRTILYAGHFAFGYFAKRYGLAHISPYTGFSPDAEPSPRRIAELIDRMKELGLSTVFYEELITPRVARVIAEQTGARMVLLHGVHNVTKTDLDAGATYIGIMRDNIEKLKAALE